MRVGEYEKDCLNLGLWLKQAGDMKGIKCSY